jgi:transcription antitermination protein NusB
MYSTERPSLRGKAGTVDCVRWVSNRAGRYPSLPMARRRHLSRIAVMQVLFERERRPDVDVMQTLSMNESELGDIDREFAETLLNGILEKEAEIGEAIQAHAPGWTLERMDPVSRCTLYVGAYELLESKDAPPAVVMNECIEIAKEFSTDESGKFVNGVLNAMVKK